MQISDNSFTKKTFSKSANSFSKGVVTKSTNAFSRKEKILGQNGWGGDNITDAGYEFDDIYSGSPYGDEYGSVRHFKARTRPAISH